MSNEYLRQFAILKRNGGALDRLERFLELVKNAPIAYENGEPEEKCEGQESFLEPEADRKKRRRGAEIGRHGHCKIGQNRNTVASA